MAAALPISMFGAASPAAAVSLSDLSVPATVSVLEGAVGSVSIDVTLNPTALDEVTVDYATTDGTATDPADYTGVTGTLTFAPGDDTETIVVPLAANDDVYEGNKDFTVTLSNASNAVIVESTTTVTINDAYDIPSITMHTTVPQNEGDAGTSTLSVPVFMSKTSAFPISVDYGTFDGTATAGSDYTSTSGTLTFAPGEWLKTIDVSVSGDTTYEANETFLVAVWNATAPAVIGNGGSSTAIITNDDDVPSVSIEASASADEGESDTLDVTLSNPSDQTITVDYTTLDGTATTDDSDYAPVVTPVQLSFAPGETSQQITVGSNEDNIREADEDYSVVLANPVGASLGDDTATMTIVNDDPKPTITIEASKTVSEGGTVSFDVTLSNPSDDEVTVDFTTVDGTAVSPADYTVSFGILSFGPRETTKTIWVDTVNDAADEPSQTFTVVLSNASPTAAGIDNATGTATITDDDTQPTVSISDASGNEDGANLSLSVTLSNPSDDTITVDYATADGSATTADGDYTAASGTLTFAPGQTSKSVSVGPTADTKYEGDEALTVGLSGLTGTATIADGTADVDILNDDAVPTIAISADDSTNEGGTVDLSVTLTNPSENAISVDYDLNDGTALVGDSDYTDDNDTLTWAPGTSATKTITVQTTADNKYENDEDLAVVLTGEVNATLGDDSATVTILNDDDAPTVSVSSNNGDEDGAPIGVSISLSNPSAFDITVDWATADGTATTADTDYTAGGDTVTFLAEETTKNLAVDPTTDNKHEGDETVLVELANLVGDASLGSNGTVTIDNDDAVPTIDISADDSVVEGGSVTYDVTVTNPSDQVISVDFTTTDGTAELADSDYGSESDTLTWAPGTTATQQITVASNADTKFELDEDLTVDLSNEANATIGNGSATMGILDDDVQPTVDITASAADDEGDVIPLTVSLSNASYQTITVDVASANGTATIADNDYTAVASTLTFTPNQTSKTVNVVTTEDTIHEADEDLTVSLSNEANVGMGNDEAAVTILNDDAQPTISIQSSASITEGNAGTAQQNLAVTLSNPTDDTITVDWASADGTATIADNDYAATSGTLTFSGRSTSDVIPVTVNGDIVLENDETFSVTLSGNNLGTLGTPVSTVTIANDDAVTASLGAGPISIREGAGGGLTPVNIPVTLNAPAAYPVTVNFTTVNATAKATSIARDFVKQSGGLVFAPGETTKDITVVINDDLVLEDFEHFYVKLNASPGITVGATQTKVIIENDEKPRLVMNNPAAQAEGKNIIFKVSLSHRYYLPIAVNVATVNGTASAPVDFESTPLTPAAVPFTILAGTKGPIPVTIKTKLDNVIEPAENFSLTASTPLVTNSPITATATIKNNAT